MCVGVLPFFWLLFCFRPYLDEMTQCCHLLHEFANELVASHSLVCCCLGGFCVVLVGCFVCCLLFFWFVDDDGSLDYVQVLHQFSFVALNCRRPRLLIWNYSFCNAIPRVKRPGGSHEGVGLKKKLGCVLRRLGGCILRRNWLYSRVGHRLHPA